MRLTWLCSMLACALSLPMVAAAQDMEGDTGEEVAPVDDAISEDALDAEEPAEVGAPPPAPPPPVGEAPRPGDRTANNALYIELAGNAGAYSLNYERFFIDDLAGRIGFSYFSVSASGGGSEANASLLLIPLMVNYLGIGGADHKLELGLGVLFMSASAGVDSFGASGSASGVFVIGTASFAYRYVPHDGGFNFKIGFTPLFGGGGFFPWGGLALGAVF